MKKRILFIVTSHSEMGDTGKKTGIWAEELTKPYEIFTDAGYEVDIYSPKGGSIVFDPNSIKEAGTNEASVDVFLALNKDAKPLSKLVNSSNYEAVFLPGGHGAMWDLAVDEKTADILTQANTEQKVIGAVCHGVAGLVNVKNSSGDALVKDKKVNSFTDEEESVAGLDDVVPFKLESKLRELGGRFEKAENWQAFAVIDGKLVTGQNPASSALVAEKMLGLMT